MNIDKKSRTSSEMLETSWRVLGTHPRLVLLPLLILAIVISFPDSQSAWRAEGAKMLLLGASSYLIGSLVLFLDVVFCYEGLRVLGGEPVVNLERGIRYAASRWRAILLWNLLAGAVGVVLHVMGARVGWFGRIGSGLFEFGWAVALLLSTPVLIRREGQNPFGVVRESVRLMRNVLGESITGLTGILIIFVAVAFVSLLGVILMSVITRIAGLDASWLVVIFLLGAFGLLALLGALGNIYCCAVYIYASEGAVPEPDALAPMDAAWKVTAKH